MEDFTITISSFDVMYYSFCIIVCSSVFLLILILILRFDDKTKKKREDAAKKQREQEKRKQLSEDFTKMDNLAFRALYNSMKNAKQGCYTETFIEELKTEARRRGIH